MAFSWAPAASHDSYDSGGEVVLVETVVAVAHLPAVVVVGGDVDVAARYKPGTAQVDGHVDVGDRDDPFDEVRHRVDLDAEPADRRRRVDDADTSAPHAAEEGIQEARVGDQLGADRNQGRKIETRSGQLSDQRLGLVQAAVAEHFDCPSVEYFPLELSGDQGSYMYHWEATFMGYDFMTAQVSQHMKITKISLALFEDSGWYMPNYELAEDMWWGKNRGCDFVHHKKCPMGDPQSNMTGEFCSFTDSNDFSFGCDVDGDTMIQCTTTGSVFSEGCPIR